MVLSSLVLFEIESNEFCNEGTFIITLERLLYRWTDEKTVPVIEKLLVKLSCIKEPSALRNALFNSAAAVGILAEKLLKAWRLQGLPNDFYDEDVTIMFNTHSDCVFLTNSEFQTCMLNGEKLESFYTCFQCGNEGFKNEILIKRLVGIISLIDFF